MGLITHNLIMGLAMPDPHIKPSSLPLIKDPHEEPSTTMLLNSSNPHD